MKEKRFEFAMPLITNKKAEGEMLENLLVFLAARGVNQEIIFAARKCGFVVTEYNEKYLSKEQLVQWAKAIVEYRQLSLRSAATIQ